MTCWLPTPQERWLEPDAEYVQAANHADGLAQRESSAATTASAADGEPQQPQSRQQDGAEASGGAGTHRTAWTREGTKEGKVPLSRVSLLQAVVVRLRQQNPHICMASLDWPAVHSIIHV